MTRKSTEPPAYRENIHRSSARLQTASGLRGASNVRSGDHAALADSESKGGISPAQPAHHSQAGKSSTYRFSNQSRRKRREAGASTASLTQEGALRHRSAGAPVGERTLQPTPDASGQYSQHKAHSTPRTRVAKLRPPAKTEICNPFAQSARSSSPSQTIPPARRATSVTAPVSTWTVAHCRVCGARSGAPLSARCDICAETCVGNQSAKPKAVAPLLAPFDDDE